MAKTRAPFVAAIVVLLLGLASGWLSGSAAADPWFAALRKPGFMPPGWAFPVAWTALYLTIGWALGLVIQTPRPARPAAVAAFLAQLALNLTWSPLFFRFHQVAAAMGVIVAMIGLTVLTAILFRRVRPLAAGLMLPYLAWLCFAATLNGAILRLN